MYTLPIYLLLDNSSSMDGNKIVSANDALVYAIKAMQQRARETGVTCLVRVIVFNTSFKAEDFILLDDYTPKPLRAGGGTDMIGPLVQVQQDLRGDLADSGYFLPPLILLITDGQHMYSEDYMISFNTYLETDFLLDEKITQAIRVAIGIGEDLDIEALKKYSSPGIPILFANNSEDLASFIAWTKNAIGGGIKGLLGAGIPEQTGEKSW